MKQSVWKDGPITLQPLPEKAAFQIQLSTTGASRSNATKYDGYLPYDSKNAYDIGADMNKEVVELSHSIKDLNLFSA